MEHNQSNDFSVLEFACTSMRNELDYLLPLVDRVDDTFVDMVDYMVKTSAKIVVSGMGKSGLIAQKIVATLNSTGTSSSFLHAGDALHGDLGLINSDDIVIILSKSGENPEIKSWMPLLRKRRIKIASIIGDLKSTIAKGSDWVLDSSVESEICPLNLAPTTSATAQLIWGDVLASTLMKAKGVTKNDFASAHPGGMLGKQILLQCKELALKNPPSYIAIDTPFVDILSAVSKSLMGAVAVLNVERHLLGLITDGDLRRAIIKHKSIEGLFAKNIMTVNPIFVAEDTLVADVFELITKKNINQMVLADKTKTYQGMIHIHQILQEGF